MSEEMEVNNEFSGETGQSDLTLIVEDHKIPVSKAVLCIASPVFQAMLEGDFKEKSMKEIPLPGKKYEDIVLFLKCIYPDKMKKITEKNTYKLLPLGHEYGVKKMIERCEKLLILIVRKSHTDNVSQLYRHIQISEKYDLEELKKKCIYLASEHNLKQLKDAQQTYKITDDSHCSIVELALKRRDQEKEDLRYLSLESVKKERVNYTETVSFSLKGKFNMWESDTEKNLRALRLTEQFKISTSETDVRTRLIQNLKHKSLGRSQYSEEFDLLPEKLKDAFQNK